QERTERTERPPVARRLRLEEGERKHNEDDRVDDNQPPQAVGRRFLAHDRSPLPSPPCEPWPPCMNKCNSGQASRNSQGNTPRKWARCSLKSNTTAMARNARQKKNVRDVKKLPCAASCWRCEPCWE